MLDLKDLMHINFGIRKENKIHIKVKYYLQIINYNHNLYLDNLYK